MRVYTSQSTADLTSTCPQTAEKDYVVSLEETCQSIPPVDGLMDHDYRFKAEAGLAPIYLPGIEL